MIDLIPLPHRILGVLLLAIGLIAGGFGYGVKTANDRHAARQLASERLAADRYHAEVARGNDLSAKLASAESNTQIKTIERIKYVPQVTTGRDCLSANALSLLNGTGYPKLSASAWKPAPEDAAAPAATDTPATDTDVAYWIAGTIGEYETCASRLNALIDWESARP